MLNLYTQITHTLTRIPAYIRNIYYHISIVRVYAISPYVFPIFGMIPVEVTDLLTLTQIIVDKWIIVD